MKKKNICGGCPCQNEKLHEIFDIKGGGKIKNKNLSIPSIILSAKHHFEILKKKPKSKIKIEKISKNTFFNDRRKRIT